MKLPSNFRYKEIGLPTSQLLKYYDSHLKGTKDLQGYLSAIAISDRLDTFVSLCIDEQCEARLYEEKGAILKLAEKDGSFNINNSRGIGKRIWTKYACARIIQLLRKIEWHQKEIKEMPYKFLQMNIRARENFDINSVYEAMMKYIDEVHSSYECIKKWSIDEDFMKTVFPIVDRTLPSFYLMFGLDYTPTSQKIKDEVDGCLEQIVGAIIAIGIVLLLALIFAR
jgi:hypothetical protein